MEFSMYPELVASGEIKGNRLDAEIVEGAIDDFLEYSDSYGDMYSVVIDLIRAGF